MLETQTVCNKWGRRTVFLVHYACLGHALHSSESSQSKTVLLTPVICSLYLPLLCYFFPLGRETMPHKIPKSLISVLPSFKYMAKKICRRPFYCIVLEILHLFEYSMEFHVTDPITLSREVQDLWSQISLVFSWWLKPLRVLRKDIIKTANSVMYLVKKDVV